MKRISIIITICSIALITYGGIWGWMLSQKTPNTWAATHVPTVIACSTRGCITSSEWNLQRSYDTAFAKQTGKRIPSDAETLSTLIRRHLITHATLQSPVNIQDAVRYRTAILHTTDIEMLQKLDVSSFEQYDSQVILPFLEQEAYMKQYDIPNTATLYHNLSAQRKILLLLFHYRWNIDKGEVEEK